MDYSTDHSNSIRKVAFTVSPNQQKHETTEKNEHLVVLDIFERDHLKQSVNESDVRFLQSYLCNDAHRTNG